jgi:hypothetical protein
MDWLVYYECSTEHLSPAEPLTLEIRKATVADTTAIAETARLCFSNYAGHYHTDARLDRVKVSEAYIWLLRCARRRKPKRSPTGCGWEGNEGMLQLSGLDSQTSRRCGATKPNPRSCPATVCPCSLWPDAAL